MIMGTYANLYLSDPGTNEVQPWKNLDVNPIKSQPLDVPLKPLELKNLVNLNEKSKYFHSRVYVHPTRQLRIINVSVFQVS